MSESKQEQEASVHYVAGFAVNGGLLALEKEEIPVVAIAVVLLEIGVEGAEPQSVMLVFEPDTAQELAAAIINSKKEGSE